MVVRRSIRIYSCPCGARLHDHGLSPHRFISEMACPRCKKIMAHETAEYDIETQTGDPETGEPSNVRVATRVAG